MNLHASKRAFALVLVLALLGLVVLVALTLATLSRVSHQAARANDHRVQARQNALLALHAAIGQLQLHVGTDPVLTGMAGVAGVPSGASSRARHWCGIWNSDRSFVTWLASGVTGEAVPDLSQGIILVSTSSLGADNTDREHVRALRVPLYSRSPQGDEHENGGYAFWVGDEGVKLSIVIPDEVSAVSGAKHVIDQQFPSVATTSPDLLRIISYEQVNLVGATTTQRQGGFHTYGRTHYSVTNSALSAGLLNVNSNSSRYWTGVGATLIRNNPAAAGSLTIAQFANAAVGLLGRPFRTVDEFLTAIAPRLTATNAPTTAFSEAIRPWLAVRSDTFRIRAYGDCVNTDTAIPREAVAYCEAIVQRTPEMLPDGIGRRFVITYFRWLGPDDI